MGTLQDVPSKTSPANVIRDSVSGKRMDFFRKTAGSVGALSRAALELHFEVHNRQQMVPTAKDFEQHPSDAIERVSSL